MSNYIQTVIPVKNDLLAHLSALILKIAVLTPRYLSKFFSVPQVTEFFMLIRCGKCRRYLKLIESKPQRLHCPVCSDTYSIPQNGSIRPYKETKCPIDDFELVLWSQGAKGKVRLSSKNTWTSYLVSWFREDLGQLQICSGGFMDVLRLMDATGSWDSWLENTKVSQASYC